MSQEATVRFYPNSAAQRERIVTRPNENLNSSASDISGAQMVYYDQNIKGNETNAKSEAANVSSLWLMF